MKRQTRKRQTITGLIFKKPCITWNIVNRK